jgi:hypothetical protein
LPRTFAAAKPELTDALAVALEKSLQIPGSNALCSRFVHDPVHSEHFRAVTPNGRSDFGSRYCVILHRGTLYLGHETTANAIGSA